MKHINRYLIICIMAGMAGGCQKDDQDIPLACFELSAVEVLENQIIEFTNCSENATAYYWEFGDGETSIDYHTSHIYKQPGSFEVSLSVFRGEYSDQLIKTVIVEEDPLPTACFTVASTDVLISEEIEFHNCSEKADSFLWDFGDGNTSTEEHPTHIYLQSGAMEVTLTVANEYGEDSTSGIINVTGADVAFFDGFENYEDFSLTFGNWTQIDNDGSATWGLAATSFPNSGYVGSFIIFNPHETDPPVADDDRFAPYNGNKYAACFSARQPPNDDWLISPEIELGEGFELSLAIKSYSDSYGPDLFVVQLLDGEETIWLSPENSPVQPPLSWTLYSYDLSAYAGKEVQVQIGCVSDDAVAMFIDDITVKTGDGKTVLRENFESTSIWQQPFSSPAKRK